MDQGLLDLISNQFFQQIFDKMDIEVAIFDKLGKYQYVSPSAIKNEELRDWIIGKDNFEYVKYRNKPIELAEKRHSTILKVIETNEVIEFDETIQSDDDKIYYYTRKVFPIQNNQDEVVGAVGYGIDLTKSILSQKLIQESEAKYRSIFENSPAAILIYDVELGRYVDCNENAVELFNMSREKLFKVGPSELNPETQPDGRETKSIIRKNINDILKGKNILVEWNVKSSDGEIIPCLVSLVKLPISNKTLIRTSLLDLRHRKKIEQEKNELQKQIMHTQKLESLGIVAGGIAHDFNNLLAGILGYTSIALQEIERDSEIKPYLQKIKKITHDAAEVTNQMLAYSGKAKFKKEYSKLSKIVKEMRQLLRITVSKTIDIEYNHSVSSDLRIDKVQVKQVILNLVINAAESYKNEKGSIKITTDEISKPVQNPRYYYYGKFQNQDYSYIEVEDFGSGISKENLKKIFDPFFTTKFTGRGLGLSVVLGIVKGHHGIIEVESSLGRGTRFRIYFPTIDTGSKLITNTKSKAAIQIIQSSTVLICEDEKYIRDMLSNMLAEMGFEVILAENGEIGIDKFKQHNNEIGMVILDLTMPVMDGKQTLSELIQINPKLQVIMMSGYSKNELSGHPNYSEQVRFLQKPFEKEELEKLINEF